MGRGRFVHPTQPRTITPHEAARIQFFPDFYKFGDPTRTTLHRMIGNAVPAKLGYALGVHLLR
jgi:DNA (cytosine-5)-methyltransferase 1